MILKKFTHHFILFIFLSILVMFVSCGGGGSDSGFTSSNANLMSLTLSNGVLNPSFNAATVAYATMFIGQSSITLTPTVEHEGATIRINGTSVISGKATAITLSSGSNTITVVVTAADGTTTKTYTVTASYLSQEAYIKASNTRTGIDWGCFGYSVSLSGDTLAVGAYGEASNATGVNGDQTDNSAFRSGAVYVFTRTGATWTQQAYIKASNTEANDYFGSSVSLSGDTLAVGAYGESSNATGVNGNQTDNSAVGSGAVYVFTRTGATWTQQAYIKASNTGANDYFGSSVSLSGDTLAVGAYGESSNATGVNGNQADNSAVGSGAVYVFTRIGATWAQQAYIKASNTTAEDYFGWGVSLSGDTLAVGAYGESSNATGVNGNQTDKSVFDSGAVYVFTRTGATWTQQAYIKASNTTAEDYFGWSVSLSGDTLAVGAYAEASNATGVNGDQTDNSAVNSGAVYVFTRTGATWTQQAYIKASNTGANDYFGSSVSLSGDMLAIGAFCEASSATGVNGVQNDNSDVESGAVYVFTRTGSTWAQQAYIKASNTGAGDYFGLGVSLSGDTLAVGAYGEHSNATGVNGDQTDNSAFDSGAVYILR